MTTNQYIETINTRFKSGISREHSYRGDLESLIRELVKGVEITNEPSNVTDCGNPDYVITKGKIPIGYIEAKDIGKDLNGKQYKEQFTRYKKALENLIITDYIWFQFFQNGVLIHEIKIGEIENNSVKPIVENFQQFENLIQNFCTYIGQTIKSSKKLAEMMASKAKLLQNILENAVTSDEKTEENTSLRDQYKTFKQILIHELTPKEFADIYSQTLAYGMFAARLHDTTLEDFSRQEAAELIPKSNPFLRKLFGYVAGPDIDERIKRTVDNLADVFRATNVEELLKNFGKSTQTNDPIIHFYETFLSEYDPKLRKSRGVWYTPEPVVNFIVRAVDDILKTEFNLPQGLADTSKTKIKVPEQGSDKLVTKEVHKVQILDPATGTGTFLSEVVKLIYNNNFKNLQGVWSSYVEEHLIPRLNGFELLMASYSMAHLKLDMLLRETGYKPTRDQRFNIYLTNSLEEHHRDTGTLFSNWLSTEANDANHIKRDTPVMVVMGNPPYSVSSSNKSEWIEKLMVDYKKDLNERNINPLSDDYLKFIRYGQHYIEKNGEGVLAYISNNSFIDGIIHRQVRKSIMETFDKVYILDLHGSSKKQEVSPDGSQDENVFDIMQGVSINIFTKTSNRKKLAEVFHLDLFGKRNYKYETLFNSNLKSISWRKITPQEPDYFFVSKDYSVKKIYSKGLKISELFNLQTSGIKTHRDAFVVDLVLTELKKRISDFYSREFTNLELKNKYKLKEDEKWIDEKRESKINNQLFKSIAFRPFDIRSIYYSNELIDRSRKTIMNHILDKDNIVALFPRQAITEKFGYFITNKICDINFTGTAGQFGAGLAFPLYLYPDQEADGVFTDEGRTPNLNQEIVNQISEKLGLTFTNEKDVSTISTTNTSFAPIDILDYIYAVLHSPTYREKYKEFLKIDFPRVPYPKDRETFWKLVKLGGEIRELHLLESPKVNEPITSYPINGDNKITRKLNKNDWEIIDDENELGRIWINDEQYFDNIPLVSWEFYIGGYQPAQKWLKDRRGRELKTEDVLHYQKIIVSLSETDRLMKEIDFVGVE